MFSFFISQRLLQKRRWNQKTPFHKFRKRTPSPSFPPHSAQRWRWFFMAPPEESRESSVMLGHSQSAPIPPRDEFLGDTDQRSFLGQTPCYRAYRHIQLG